MQVRSLIENQQDTTNSQLHFEIEDTGPGIASDELDSIFEAFVQTQTGKQSQEGTGLGLPISRSFVRLMGGEITVSSVVGKGSIFRFDINVSKVDATSVPAKQPSRRVIALEPNQQQFRILIVDDKSDNRQLLVQLLSPLGFELKEASNGQEAMEIWHSFEPHLIWMDLQMPVMDGYEATRRIKATNKGQATAIIALSASNLAPERAVGAKVGWDDFIRKPFREAEIFAAMHKHLKVRFVLEAPASVADSTPTETVTLTPENLAVIAADWLADFHQATTEGDFDLMLALIEQIRSTNEPIANALADLANNFRFVELLALTQDRSFAAGSRGTDSSINSG